MSSSDKTAPRDGRSSPVVALGDAPRKSRRRRSRRRSRLSYPRIAASVLGVCVLCGVLWAWFGPVAGGGEPAARLLVHADSAPREPASAALGGLPAVVGQQPLTPQAVAAPADMASTQEASGDLRVPEPVPLQRDARVARTLAPDEAVSGAVVAASPAARTITLADGRGTAQLGGAVVKEGEVGLLFYPAARVDANESSIVRDSAAGNTQSVGLVSQDGFDKVASFYRDQMRSVSGGGSAREVTASPGQLLIESTDSANGGQRSVLIWRDGTDVRITLSRWVPPARNGARGG